MLELKEIRSFGVSNSNVEAEESVEFLHEQGTQPTRIDCKRKANADMFMWIKEKEEACFERG